LASEDYPFCPDAIVQIGKDIWVTLCCRVALVPGHGQVWHTTGDKFVLSGQDVRGQTTWSVLGVSLTEFMVSLKVPSSSYEWMVSAHGWKQMSQPTDW
jgi:hypothetical protein